MFYIMISMIEKVVNWLDEQFVLHNYSKIDTRSLQKNSAPN
ncbi:hypothetical protein bcere0022_25200 [Bacillus cereus Rock3-44]|nr:hypothetical protein bcere0022_25200 [Bacillus cereus Rock3-44]